MNGVVLALQAPLLREGMSDLGEKVDGHGNGTACWMKLWFYMSDGRNWICDTSFALWECMYTRVMSSVTL
jgi:hypothetical protein